MTRAQALAILGLDEGASDAEIEAAWRVAIKDVHPDSGQAADVDADAVTTIMDARQIALNGQNGDSRSLVSAAMVTDLVKAQQQETAVKAQASERAMRGVVMHHVGTLAFRRRQRTMLAGISAAVAAVLGLLAALSRATPDAPELQFTLATTAVLFAVAAAVVGILAWRVAALERALQMELDEVAETLSDRAAFSDAIIEIGVGSFFTRAELHAAIDEWSGRHDGPTTGRPLGLFMGPYLSVPLSRTAGFIGATDFAKLLVAKGIEMSLLAEGERVGPDESITYGFTRA